MSYKRETWLDESKGIGILLVVLGHVILGFLNANMYLDKKNLLEYVFFTIYSFHMPLFFIISGYLYKKTWQIKNIQNLKVRIINKFIALGIPYIIFSLAFGISKVIMSGDTNSELTIKDILKIPIHPIGPYWFLYALMGLFILVPILEYSKLNTKIILLIALSLTILSNIFTIKIVFISTTFQNILYFYIGCILFEIFNYEKYFKLKKLLLKFNVLLFFVYIVTNILYFNLSKSIFISNIFIGIILAISASIFIINIFYKYNKNNKVLITMGKLSLPIYLMHIILTAGIRIIFIKLGLNNFIIQISVGILLGILIPILIYKLITRIKVFDFMFNPNKYLKYKK
ncbi:MAG: acyltransferase family protein [Clostridium sp.]